MTSASRLHGSNPFANLGPTAIFTESVAGFYGVGSLMRDLLGTVHLSWLVQTSFAWRLGGAISYALTAHCWWLRARSSVEPPASRPAV